MTPSVSTLQRLTLSMHEWWESLGPETLGSIREAAGADRLGLPRRRHGAAETPSRQGLLARGRLRHGPRRRGQAPEDPLSCRRAALHAGGGRHRRARPEIGIVAIADGRRRPDLPPSRLAWNICTASDHAVAPQAEKCREIPVTIPVARQGDRGRCATFDAAAAPDRAASGNSPSSASIAMHALPRGSPCRLPVEAANKW